MVEELSKIDLTSALDKTNYTYGASLLLIKILCRLIKNDTEDSRKILVAFSESTFFNKIKSSFLKHDIFIIPKEPANDRFVKC
jgi:hypothetical protein